MWDMCARHVLKNLTDSSDISALLSALNLKGPYSLRFVNAVLGDDDCSVVPTVSSFVIVCESWCTNSDNRPH